MIRVSAAATRSDHRRLFAIDREVLSRKTEDARRNARRREVHILHRGPQDPLQRMLNAVQPGSYIQPHRHLDPPKDEAVVVLRGAFAFIPFQGDGTIDEGGCLLLGAEHAAVGVDVRAELWHTLLALEPDSVFFEVKAGPYDPAQRVQAASWAPAEGSPEASDYLAGLEDRVRARLGLGSRGWQPDRR